MTIQHDFDLVPHAIPDLFKWLNAFTEIRSRKIMPALTPVHGIERAEFHPLISECHKFFRQIRRDNRILVVRAFRLAGRN